MTLPYRHAISTLANREPKEPDDVHAHWRPLWGFESTREKYVASRPYLLEHETLARIGVNPSDEGERAVGYFHYSPQSASIVSARLAQMEEKLDTIYRLLLTMSQSYYWTTEWQDKEQRADKDAALGRSRLYGSAEDLIKALKS